MLRPSFRITLVCSPLVLLGACGDGDTPAEGGGGQSGTSSTTSTKAATGTGSTSSSSTSASTTSASTSASTTGVGGSGGGDPWPTCDTQPPGSVTKTLPEIWVDNPATPTAAWVPGVFVTAVAGGGCTANTACQLFVQQEESYASLALATHQSLRVGVAPDAAVHFEGIAVGDQIDLYARAFRDTTDGANELFFLVASSLPGCAAVVGAGDPQPVDAVLDDLTVAAYEVDMGPVLVRVDTVSGNPNLPAETFGLWDTGTMPGGDITTITSLSPFFLPGGTFNGLVDGMNTDFVEVVGVFGLFVPPADPLIKYEEIYVRTDADYPLN